MTGAWLVDVEYLRRVTTGEEPYVLTRTLNSRQPYFDIDIVSDVSSPDPKTFVDQLKELRRPFDRGRPSHLLVSCGDLMAGLHGVATSQQSLQAELDRLEKTIPAVLAVPGNGDVAAAGSAEATYKALAGAFIANTELPSRPWDLPVASVTRVMTDDDDDPLAYIVVIGFDSNAATYDDPLIHDHGQISPAQLDASRTLVNELAGSVAQNTPLYVFGVTHHNLMLLEGRALSRVTYADGLRRRMPELECCRDREDCEPSALCVTNHMLAESGAGTAANSSAFLAHCRSVRMSIVIHANMRKPEVTTVSSASLVVGESPTDMSIVACPPFAPANDNAGMARIRVNVRKGEAEIAFRYNVNDAGGGSPIQIVRPLISASRITPSERRLYRKVGELLDAAAGQSPDAVKASVDAFHTHMTRTWHENGYVSLCLPDGTLPDLAATRRTRYNLLLLVRKVEDGRYDVLLSHHTALRPSELADWYTLLLPAFQDVRHLLERLRDDVVRQVVDQVGDMQKAKQVHGFEKAVGWILDQPEFGDDLWADQLREVDFVSRRKISPTTGCVTDYDYHLVTLLPLIRRPEKDTVTHEEQNELDYDALRPEEQRRQAYETIIKWLDQLPSVRHGRHGADGRVVPIAALQTDGGGLRWDPSDKPADVARRLPPGGVWFPLPDWSDDAADPLWPDCPGIVSRNADVMSWVYSALKTRWQNNGSSLPPELVMGELSQKPNVITIVEQYPFERDDALPSTTTLPSRSTLEALSRVQLIAGYDLEGIRPYDGLAVERVYLVRRDVPGHTRERPVIAIFSADQFEAEDCREAPIKAALGTLRPVQRHVMRAGLERAREVHDRVLTQMKDPWGFARVGKGETPTLVSVTPPIIEQLHPDDWDDERGESEYLLCDGSHRVVELVWQPRYGSAAGAPPPKPVVLPAIAIRGTPRQPYYAIPFSRQDWSVTAGNVQDRSPDQAWKYTVRQVDRTSLDATALATLMRQSLNERDWYRRYFRDLSAGFGYMGGQGGRYV
jgi:hypothetical protein